VFFSRVPLTFIVVVVGLIGSLTCVGFALTSIGPSDNTAHSGHVIKGRSFDSIQIAYVEHAPTIIREGDAKVSSDLVIDSESLEPDNGCEFCTQVTYSPGKDRIAAVAYQVDKVDLSLSKRIVFFAKGDKGGEQLVFVAAGKSVKNGSGIVDDADRNLFPDQGFGIMTDKITLADHWKRYQIGLISSDLRDITHPFGFVLMAGNMSQTQKIFLKGITYDNKLATDSIAILPNGT
jgi:hypothetical protein